MQRRDVLAALAGAAGAGTAGCLGSAMGSDGAPWRGFQHDAGHSGASPGASGPADGARVEWRTDTWGHRTSPVAADGTVYAGSGLRDAAVHAVDAATGERRWRVAVDDEVERALAVADGTVYVAAGGVYALAADTGDRQWAAPGRGGRGLAVADGTVYAAERRGSPIVALAADTGEVRWRRDLHTRAAPAVADGRVVVGVHDGVVALDAASGETAWRGSLSDRGSTPPTVAGGRVYVGTRRGVVALDAATGEEAWTFPGNFGASDLAATDGTVYVPGRQREGDGWAARAVAVDAATGEPRWTHDAAGLAGGSTAVADGVVYLSGRNRLYALDVATGERRWWLRFQWPVGAPALVDGRVVLSVGGRLTAVGPGDGRDGTWRSAVEPAPDRTVSPPDPGYPGSDFSFGTDGYEVTARADATVDEDAPVDATLAVEGDAIDADETVTLTFALENRGDETLRFLTGAPEPFGVVWFRGADRSLAAWTPAYEESGHVHTTDHRGVTMVNAIGLSTTVPPGETVRETYALSAETHGIQPGTYEYSRTLQVEPEGDHGGEEGWTVEAGATVTLDPVGPEEGSRVADLAVAHAVASPDGFPGEFSVDVLEPATDAHPGLIEIAVTSVADERELVATTRRWPFGSYVGLGLDGKRLVLLAEEMYAPGHVERGADGWWRPAFLPHEAARRGRSTTAFDPGEKRSRRYVVLAHPDTGGPEPGETYAFEQGFAGESTDVTWGFALSVLDPSE